MEVKEIKLLAEKIFNWKGSSGDAHLLAEEVINLLNQQEEKICPACDEGPVTRVYHCESCNTEFVNLKEAGVRKKNIPIEELLAEYTAENCDFTDIEWVIKTTNRLILTLPDAQSRCLLHVLAGKMEDAVKEIESLKAEIEKLKEGLPEHKHTIRNQDKLILSLNNKLKGYQKITKEHDELKDFAIWMTGCGYDFCQHEYFIEQRDKLLK